MRLGVRVAFDAARTLDDALLVRAAAFGCRPGWHEALLFVTRLGDGIVWIAAAAVALLGGGDAGLWLVVRGAAAGAGGAALHTLCKRWFLRRRPCQTLPDLPIAWLPPSDFSFPSGHTLHAFANATLIALHCPPAAVPVLLFAACVGASRVFLAAHFPSDVLAGMLLGIAIAFGVVAFI